MTPIVYSSDDAGAPVVTTSTAGTIAAMLKACLVTGYGSRDPVGWTCPYEDTNVIVLQNMASEGASGAYFKISNTSSGAGQIVTLQAYSSMSDINTGTDATGIRRFVFCRSWGTTNCKWKLVADEKTVYFYTDPQEQTYQYRTWGGFGDFHSLVDSDPFNYCVIGTTDTNTVYTNNLDQITAPNAGGDLAAGDNSSSAFSVAKDHTGTTGPLLYNTTGYKTLNSSFCGGASLPTLPNATGAPEMVYRPVLCRQGIIRGFLRGIDIPMNNLTSFSIGDLRTGGGFRGPGSEVMYFPVNGNKTDGRFYVECGVAW